VEIPRRRFLHLAAGGVALPAVSRIARAQTYPTKPVRIVVGFAAGGGTDIVARLIGQWLSERLGQAFLIENRTGVGGSIATEAVVRAPPDGLTLLMVGKTYRITLSDAIKRFSASESGSTHRDHCGLPVRDGRASRRCARRARK
jgi:tripartite-type tricarboxylate transporter receptor subunit TctC